jgi:hypothetical protein
VQQFGIVHLQQHAGNLASQLGLRLMNEWVETFSNHVLLHRDLLVLVLRDHHSRAVWLNKSHDLLLLLVRGRRSHAVFRSHGRDLLLLLVVGKHWVWSRIVIRRGLHWYGGLL